MILLKSLSHKIVFSLCLLLAIISFYIYIDLSASYHVSNEASRIKYASQLRFRAYEMAWLAQRIAERETAMMDEETRKGLVIRLKNEIASFERIMKDLRDGNSKEGLEKLTYRDAIILLDSIYGEWTDTMKPALVQLADMPSSISEKQARNLLEPFDNRLAEVAYTADMLVVFLDDDYRHEIREYRQFRLYIFGFFLASATFIIFYVRKRIVQPVKSLQNAAKEIAKGNYDVHVDVKTTDEIGEFGQAFNLMADEIATAFGEVLHSEDVMALNRALHKFVGIQKEEDLYMGICKHARELFGLETAWLGLLNEGDHNVRIVARSGFDDGYLSHATVTWDDSEYGMGPEGLAIKTNLPQIINDMELADTSLPGIHEALRQGYRSCMAQPLICADCAVIGVLVFYSEQKDHFTANMAELCQIFVNHAASVIENVILLKDLEARVQERTEKLRDALLLAESANRAKSAFLSNMSHDLRTPLNAIIGFSEAMSQGIYGEIRADHKEYLVYIYQSGMKLLKLINEVLDLSKIETGGMELDYAECNISDILNSALYIFREKAKKHRIGITVDVAEDARILTVDEAKIKQVLVNLLTDSINATPDNGTIQIEAAKVLCRLTGIRCHSQADGAPEKDQYSPERECIQITVTDSRSGMTAEERLRFFDPYKQFETTLDRKQDNVGLLLSKRFLELHGGRIWAEGLPTGSSEGGSSEGNRFIFVLPTRP